MRCPTWTTLPRVFKRTGIRNASMSNGIGRGLGKESSCGDATGATSAALRVGYIDRQRTSCGRSRHTSRPASMRGRLLTEPGFALRLLNGIIENFLYGIQTKNTPVVGIFSTVEGVG